MPILGAEQLRKMSIEIFKAADATDEEARIIVDFLVGANLAGHDSHGIIRIPRYVQLISEGKIRPGAMVEIVRETSSSALVNGNWGFGQVVGVKAMEIAIRKAKEHTTSSVAVFNCNHIGRLIDYSQMALSHNMIGIVMANDGKIVAPFGGMERMLNTCPISFAIPAGRESPFLLDIATSVVAEGKIRVKLHRNERTPEGWIIDKEGKHTTNPADLYSGGSILPLGGSGGYKGFGLGLVVEILGGILSGAGCACSEEYKWGNGVFMEAINIEDFMPVTQFKEKMDKLIVAMKSSRKAPGFSEILIPGEPELRMEKKRMKGGIPIPDRTWKELLDTANKFNINVSTLDASL